MGVDRGRQFINWRGEVSFEGQNPNMAEKIQIPGKKRIKEREDPPKEKRREPRFVTSGLQRSLRIPSLLFNDTDFCYDDTDFRYG